MPFVCYVNRSGGGVPYMEVIDEADQVRAVARMRALLLERIDGVSAELFDGDVRIALVENFNPSRAHRSWAPRAAN